MTDLRQFCSEFGIDENRARDAITREGRGASLAVTMPWYVRLMVGFGAWLTAIVAIAFGAAILYLRGMHLETVGVAMMFLGIAYLGLGLWLLRRTGSHTYTEQLGIAISAAGIALATGGIGLELEEIWAALLASIILTTVIVSVTANQTLQFLAALLTVGWFGGTLIEFQTPYYLGIAALVGLAGVVLMLRPPRHNLHSVAIILLLVFPILDRLGIGATYFFAAAQVEAGGWVAKALYIGFFAWLGWIHWQRAETADVRMRLSVFAATAVVVGILLPPGGMAALMIIMLAFVIGSRPLALLGVLLQINYIWRFYYDMEVTLLIKSEILIAVGVALVVAWWLMMRRSPEGVRL